MATTSIKGSSFQFLSLIHSPTCPSHPTTPHHLPNPHTPWDLSLILRLFYISESPREIVNHSLLDPNSRVLDSVGLGQGPRICLSNKFPDNAETADLTSDLCILQSFLPWWEGKNYYSKYELTLQDPQLPADPPAYCREPPAPDQKVEGNAGSQSRVQPQGPGCSVESHK